MSFAVPRPLTLMGLLSGALLAGCTVNGSAGRGGALGRPWS
jgi:hypothetical protein